MSALGAKVRFVVGASAFVVAGGCAGVRPTPAPIAGFGTVDTIAAPSDKALGDYVGQLRFDENYYAGDEQRLAVGRYPDAHYGPLVKIEPEIGNYRLSEEALHQGRIIARMINRSDEPYPKLGIAAHSTTYWWAQLGADSATNRSVMISVDAKGAIISRAVRPLYFERHRDGYQPGPQARWIWSDDDEQGWSACGSSCCRN